MKTYNVLYDNIREPITLGGILVVRKECEIKVQKGANINFFYKKKIKKIEKDLILNAFSSSIYKFRILKLKRKNKKKFKKKRY